jgi:F0F1-type ATP synthase membrane subunit b/b'
MYHAQEQLHKQLQEREASFVADARAHADAAIKLAKTQLAADVESAKASLAADSESLANQIAETILRRNAA